MRVSLRKEGGEDWGWDWSGGLVGGEVSLGGRDVEGWVLMGFEAGTTLGNRWIIFGGC